MRVAVLASLLAVALVACRPGGSLSRQPDARRSMVGATAELRIVSIAPSTTELVFALGAGDALVGRTIHCDHPSEVRSVPSVGSGLAIDVEAVLSIRPSLIIGSGTQRDSPQVQMLREAGLEVLLVPDLELADVAVALTVLGARLGAEDASSRLQSDISARMASVRALRAVSPRPRVLVVIDRDPLFAAGRESFVGELLEVAGGENVLEGSWTQIDDEALLSLRPDLVVESTRFEAEAGYWERYRSVPAVREGRICHVVENLMARPGPRIAAAAEAFAACVRSVKPVGSGDPLPGVRSRAPLSRRPSPSPGTP